jgi:hypothetical protein
VTICIYVGDVTIPIHFIEYNKAFLQVDHPIRLQYSNQIKLFSNVPSKESERSCICVLCVSIL